LARPRADSAAASPRETSISAITTFAPSSANLSAVSPADTATPAGDECNFACKARHENFPLRDVVDR
jgi:hypothetical protein